MGLYIMKKPPTVDGGGEYEEGQKDSIFSDVSI